MRNQSLNLPDSFVLITPTQITALYVMIVYAILAMLNFMNVLC